MPCLNFDPVKPGVPWGRLRTLRKHGVVAVRPRLPAAARQARASSLVRVYVLAVFLLAATLSGATAAAASTVAAAPATLPPNAATPTATAFQVPDTLAQRALACTGCHGPQGRSTPLGYVPRIAGKPAGYLAAQLRAFRDGQRQHDAMARLLVHLGDDYLAELAGHFAALQVPYPAPAPAQGTPASRALGQRLVQQGDAVRGLPACTSCHGRAMTGVEPAVPGLLGLPRDYLVAQLGAWRTGLRVARAPDCMAQLAERLQPHDITALADWLATQPLPARTGAEPAPGTGQAPALPMPCGSTAP